MMIKSNEFAEGQDAALCGLTDADCPYPIGTDEAMDWVDGLCDEDFLSD